LIVDFDSIFISKLIRNHNFKFSKPGVDFKAAGERRLPHTVRYIRSRWVNP